MAPENQKAEAPDIQHLNQVAGFLKRAGTRLRYVDYHQAESDVLGLAVKLRQMLGEETLRSASFVAIPRGGLVVLGMLSYALDLQREQLDGRNSEAALVILVDDCSLSGMRLRQKLDRLEPPRRVVVAHLYSAPELRRAVEEAEPQVDFCVAAQDLEDRSRSLYPDPEEHAAWQRIWLDRLGSDRYWLGLPELVAFAWSEPDRPFWNSATERIEDGWRFVPPHRCLKSRARLVRHLPEVANSGVCEPVWRSAAELVWGEFDGVLWLCHTGSQQVYSLDPSASLAWKALVTGADLAGAAKALTTRFEVDAGAARSDVEALVAALVGAGLLERVDG